MGGGGGGGGGGGNVTRGLRRRKDVGSKIVDCRSCVKTKESEISVTRPRKSNEKNMLSNLKLVKKSKTNLE